MIVVFGSINVDLLFRVSALPRAGETVLCPGYGSAAGGKGLNQAVAAARAQRSGAEPARMIGCVGRDGFADRALGTMESAGVDITGVAQVDAPTGCAAICVDAAGENQITVASGANLRAEASLVPDSLLGPETVLVLQMEVPAAANEALIARATARGARIVLNLAPAGPIAARALGALEILVLNEIEAAMLADASGLPAAPAAAAGRAIAEAGGTTTIVSLGSAGAIAFARGGQAWSVGALPIEPVDSVGAGDAFVGTVAVGLAGGLTLPETLHRASVAAGLACLRAGAAPSMPGADEIDARADALAPARRM